MSQCVVRMTATATASQDGVSFSIRMSRHPTPTKASGGGGYTFADSVAAAFFAQMLKGQLPFEPELGILTAVEFETRESGYIFDDLLLITQHATHASRC